MKRLLALGLLIATSAFALRPIDPVWRDVDVDKNGTNEKVAVTNLADIAFNQQGQIVGWYVKVQRAADFKDNYGRATNLVKPSITPPGTLSDFKAASAQFSKDSSSGDLVAEFRQDQTVLTYKIHPRLLTIDVLVNSPTARTLTWSGIGNIANPATKWLGAGADAPSATGSGPATYVSWQTQPKAGFAMVLRPKSPTPIQFSQNNGAAIAQVAVPTGGLAFEVFGGANEMVRFHVEKFLELPGLFEPNIWGQISIGLLSVFEATHRLVGGSWILAIVLVTLLIRLLLWPLMHQQYKSMAEMNKLKPLIDEINAKYSKKEDAQKRQEATMKLYQEHKINPAAGCLPIFLQMPILFLIYKIMVSYEFGQGVLWLPDLALPDPIYVLPIIYIGSLLLSTYLSAAGNPQAMRQGMMMNLVFAFLLFSFPAGVTIYWILSTLISLAQQWIINKQLGIRKTPAMAMVSAAPANTKKAKPSAGKAKK